MTAPVGPLLVSRTKAGNFRVSHGSLQPEEWSGDKLHTFLVTHGYTADDARACVSQAEVAHAIEIGFPG
jgi:hypothetical protein